MRISLFVMEQGCGVEFGAVNVSRIHVSAAWHSTGRYSSFHLMFS